MIHVAQRLHPPRGTLTGAVALHPVIEFSCHGECCRLDTEIGWRETVRCPKFASVADRPGLGDVGFKTSGDDRVKRR
jgi:hypothetical protein